MKNKRRTKTHEVGYDNPRSGPCKPRYTPTPWRSGDAGHTIFGPPNGNPSPVMVAKGLGIENARLIVRAVNCHEELVSKLREIASAFCESMTREELLEIDALFGKAEG